MLGWDGRIVLVLSTFGGRRVRRGSLELSSIHGASEAFDAACCAVEAQATYA